LLKETAQIKKNSKLFTAAINTVSYFECLFCSSDELTCIAYLKNFALKCYGTLVQLLVLLYVNKTLT